MKFSVVTTVYNQQPFLAKRLLPALNAQTFKDFEWVIANDGSLDSVDEWASNKGIKIYTKLKNTGYNLVSGLNNAAKLCEGDYLVWIMGDSLPADNFLEELSKIASPNKMVNGVRVNTNFGETADADEHVSQDWRIDKVVQKKLFNLNQNFVKVDYVYPWELMTLNSMCMPRDAFKKMGGIPKEYSAYGQMDSDMAAWCHYNGIELWWALNAIIYHKLHGSRPDDPKNEDFFNKRLKEFQTKGGE